MEMNAILADIQKPKLVALVVRAECYKFLTVYEWLLLTELCQFAKRSLRKVERQDTLFISEQSIMSFGHENDTPILSALPMKIDFIHSQWPNLSLGFIALKHHSECLWQLDVFAHLNDVEIYRCQEIADLTPLANLNRVALYTCSKVVDVSPLKNVKIVSLDSCHGVKDITCLTNVQELYLNRCFDATDISNLNQLRVLSMEANNEHATILRGVESSNKLEAIKLVNVGIEDLSLLRTVKKIEMYNSNRLQFGMLSTIHELFLHTARIQDVESLQMIPKISLHGCWLLNDISPFAAGAVQYLDLTDCTSIRDVSMLGGVHTLILTNCYRISNVSNLGKVYHLNLTGCWNVSDVSQLGNVKELYLSGCGKITSVDALHHVHRLTLNSNRRIHHIGDMHCKSLTLIDCNFITNVNGLRFVEELYIDGCRSLVNVCALSKVTSLTLRNCPSITDVSSLKCLKFLELAHCSGITDVSQLGNVRKLYLERIPFLDAAGLGTVRNLTIEECWGFKNCAALKGVTFLRLNGCGCPKHLHTRNRNQ